VQGEKAIIIEQKMTNEANKLLKTKRSFYKRSQTNPPESVLSAFVLLKEGSGRKAQTGLRFRRLEEAGRLAGSAARGG
jgi:hypothetical protein